MSDEMFRRRLLADYDRLIEQFDLGIAQSGEKFGMWLTPMEGKLVLAALREARQMSPHVPPRLAP